MSRYLLPQPVQISCFHYKIYIPSLGLKQTMLTSKAIIRNNTVDCQCPRAAELCSVQDFKYACASCLHHEDRDLPSWEKYLTLLQLWRFVATCPKCGRNIYVSRACCFIRICEGAEQTYVSLSWLLENTISASVWLSYAFLCDLISIYKKHFRLSEMFSDTTLVLGLHAE